MSKIFEALQRSRGNPNDPLPLDVAGEAPAIDEPLPQTSNGDAPKDDRQTDIRTVTVRVPKGLPVLPFDTSHTTAAEQYP